VNKEMMKKIPLSRIILTLVVIFGSVFGLASLLQYYFTGTNLFETLGFIISDKCSATLTLSKQSNACLFDVKIITENCNNRFYELKEGSCFGETKCSGIIGYDSFQSKCTIEGKKGINKYSLCISGREKDKVIIEC